MTRFRYGQVSKEKINNELSNKSKNIKSKNKSTREMVYNQIDTGDIIKVKQTLDESVAATFLDDMEFTNDCHFSCRKLEKQLFKEDHSLNNIKLLLMGLACIFALVAQFTPIPFPASRVLLAICCTTYFLLSGIIQLIMLFVEKDCILITKPMIQEQTSKLSIQNNPLLITHGLRIRTCFPRFSENYSVIIEFQGVPNSPFVKRSWSVGLFFDKMGMFDEYGFRSEIKILYKDFEVGSFHNFSYRPDKKKTNLVEKKKICNLP